MEIKLNWGQWVLLEQCVERNRTSKGLEDTLFDQFSGVSEKAVQDDVQPLAPLERRRVFAPGMRSTVVLI